MTPLSQIEAVAAPLPGANIDTDQIVPARYLQKPRSANFAEFLFRDLRTNTAGTPHPAFVLNEPAYASAKILVTGPNFGCGSSREHAVWALHDGGFRVVIAPSFGDIFYANALKNGLLPVCQEQPVIDRLLRLLQEQPGATLAVDLVTQTLRSPAGDIYAFNIQAFARQCLLEGLDPIDYTLSQLATIKAFERAGLNTGYPVLPPHSPTI